MKRMIYTIIGLILLFISTTFIVAYVTINNGSFLTNFKFKSITTTGLDFYVYFDEVKAAEYYNIVVYDNENYQIYKDKLDTNSTQIKFDKLNFNETYKIVVIAYDKEGNQKSVKEPYSFLWNDLTFDKSNLVVMNNDKDYILKFVGNYKNKDYKLSIKENDVLKEIVDIKSDEFVIKNNEFKDKKLYYTLEILDENIVISSLKLFNLISPISDIVFTSVSDGDIKDYNDVPINFIGGDNASNYLLELYGENNKLIRRKEINSKNVILSNNLFDKEQAYKVKIIASYYDYVDYSKTSEVNFTINAKETLKPVYTNYSSLVKPKSKIKLLNTSSDAKIYYTTDGSDPKVFGKEYTSDIIINENMTIKAYAKEDKKNDSIVSTFDFKVGSKNKYKVYLSASNQSGNLGVSEVGYTTEKNEMNDLTNYIEKRLNEYGVKTYRNEYGDMNRWISDSNYLGVDLHLAIHSNASEDHNAYGVETWIDESSSKTYSLAQNIQNNIMSVYYNNDDELSDRGVKYASGSLGEVNENYLPFGILLEIGHHDYKDDAKWIMENKQKIANEIADSILKYFGIL